MRRIFEFITDSFGVKKYKLCFLLVYTKDTIEYRIACEKLGANSIDESSLKDGLVGRHKDIEDVKIIKTCNVSRRCASELIEAMGLGDPRIRRVLNVK